MLCLMATFACKPVYLCIYLLMYEKLRYGGLDCLVLVNRSICVKLLSQAGLHN